MPLAIESVFPIRAFVVIGYVVAFTVNTFESMRVWFTLFGFETWRVQFEVSLAAPSHVSVIFDFMRATAFLTFGPMSFVRKGGMSLFPTVMILRYSWIHVRSSDSGNTSAIVEGVVD